MEERDGVDTAILTRRRRAGSDRLHNNQLTQTYPIKCRRQSLNPNFSRHRTRPFSRMPFGHLLTAWNPSALLAGRSILRSAIQVLALAGVALGASQVVFELTAVCRIPKDQSQFAWAQVTLDEFGKALQRYRADCRSFPTLQIGLQALVANPGVTTWNGPYFRGSLIDPWGRPYLYDVGDGVAVVRSLGADGKPGGGRYDADLSSQNPMAPPYESRFQVARSYLQEKMEPWLVLAASLSIWVRASNT